MTLDSSINSAVVAFYAGQAVYLSYFSGDLASSLSSLGNVDSIFILMLSIFILWSFLKPIIVNFLLWWWFGRHPLASKLDDDVEDEHNIEVKRWGSRHLQNTILKYLDALTQLLLQIVLNMFATLVFGHWDLYQYSIFDKWIFVLVFLAALYAFLGIIEETEVK